MQRDKNKNGTTFLPLGDKWLWAPLKLRGRRVRKWTQHRKIVKEILRIIVEGSPDTEKCYCRFSHQPMQMEAVDELLQGNISRK